MQKWTGAAAALSVGVAAICVMMVMNDYTDLSSVAGNSTKKVLVGPVEFTNGNGFLQLESSAPGAPPILRIVLRGRGGTDEDTRLGDRVTVQQPVHYMLV